LDRLLAEGVFKTQQADSKIHGEQFLNSLVKPVDQEVALGLANSVEIDSEDLDL